MSLIWINGNFNEFWRKLGRVDPSRGQNGGKKFQNFLLRFTFWKGKSEKVSIPIAIQWIGFNLAPIAGWLIINVKINHSTTLQITDESTATKKKSDEAAATSVAKVFS